MTDRFMTFLRAHLKPEQRRLVKFLVVGVSGVPVNLGTVFAATVLMPAASFVGMRDWLSPLLGVERLTSAGVRDGVAFGLGIVLSIFTNFVLNNWWTWGDRVAAGRRGFARRLVKFYLVSTIAAAIQLATSTILSALLRGNEFFSTSIHGEYRVYHVLAPAAGILVGLVINFAVNNLWTFRSGAHRDDQLS